MGYAYALWKFAHQFFTSTTSNPSPTELVDISIKKLTSTIKREMLTEGRVKEVIFSNVEIIRALYADFESKFLPGGPEYIDRTEDIRNKITRTGASDVDMNILMCMCKFNKHVLKTNFYKPGKIALSFRLDPAFLHNSDYSRVPFGIFFVVGAEFRGFHIRFVDVARGGIRVIRSANPAAFAMNVSTLFEENYNLALTQQRKNKDIPEGGSKGTILLSTDHQDKALVAFQKYVDALLDLLLPDANIRDYYGMTTRSIHQYVLGILEKKGLQESSIRKFQTGGPDGDLGSNEIKISKDKTVGIVDGSGVLYDPEGIDRLELVKLANERVMSDHFDTSKLSKNGFFIGIHEYDRVLP